MTDFSDVSDGNGVRVEPVGSGKDLERFIRFPWRIYAQDPAWVPPLIREQRKILDRDRHPFHRHAKVEYFLAWKGSRIVGRIAAILNPRHNDFHQEKTGFFETIDDGGVAVALLETAEGWLLERGMRSIVGPMNFTTNDESHSPGILLDGFEKPPFVLMAHGRPYYRELVEAAGYRKGKDLLAYLISSTQPPERICRAVARIEAGIPGLCIRQVDLRRLPEEVAIVQEIYNSAWEKNWGFVPLTEAEIAHLARELKPIIEPRYALIATVHEEPVGFSLTLPDLNQALRHVNGRLFPLGMAKLLWHARRIDRARVFALGLKPEARGTGIDAVFYLRAFEAARALGHTGAECSWILEDNWKMRRALEKVGARVHKTYRVYEKRLSPGGG
ncbi:MAG: N-acetyltransferase [Gemmatimonadota bacterium]